MRFATWKMLLMIPSNWIKGWKIYEGYTKIAQMLWKSPTRMLHMMCKSREIFPHLNEPILSYLMIWLSQATKRSLSEVDLKMYPKNVYSLTSGCALLTGNDGRQTEFISSPLNFGIAENIASAEFKRQNNALFGIQKPTTFSLVQVGNRRTVDWSFQVMTEPYPDQKSVYPWLLRQYKISFVLKNFIDLKIIDTFRVNFINLYSGFI